MAYRAFYALPAENFSTHTGQHTNAVYGFTSMLINVLRDEAPTHIAVAFDVSRQTFRTEAYAEYKAGRSATPSEFEGQISLVQEILGALRIPFVQVEGYEADDVIATLTSMATTQGMDVLICSGDRDAFQLVSDQVTVLYPVRGVSELWRMTPAAVTEKYGVPPTRYSDLAALVGESSDNLPGVPGVGPKTAAKWIGMYAGLDGIVANIDQIGGKAGESLREHLESVLRNRRLNQLVHDLPVGVELADLARASWDREQVHEVFDALEFRVLRERLFATFEAPEPEAESGFAVDGRVLGSGEVAGWLAQQAPAGVRTGLQVLGRWGRGTGDARGLALATGAGAAAYLDLTGLDDVGEQALAAWLADPTRPKAIHDGKGPAQALAARGLDLVGVTSDTALAAYLVKPDQRDYDLADLPVRLLRRELRDAGFEPSAEMVRRSIAEAESYMPPSWPKTPEAEKKLLAGDPNVQLKVAIRLFLRKTMPEKFKISDAEIEDYYRSNQRDFLIPAQIECDEIAVKPTEAPTGPVRCQLPAVRLMILAKVWLEASMVSTPPASQIVSRISAFTPHW